MTQKEFADLYTAARLFVKSSSPWCVPHAAAWPDAGLAIARLPARGFAIDKSHKFA
jgi:hypothetical protein